MADTDREMITLLSKSKGGNSATFAANFPTFSDLVAFGRDWEGDPLCKSIPSAFFETRAGRFFRVFITTRHRLSFPVAVPGEVG